MARRVDALVGRAPARVRRTLSLIVAVTRGAREDRLTGLAAEVAYFGMLSMFPALLALATSVTVIGRIGDATLATEAQRIVVLWLERIFTAEADAMVTTVGELFERSNGDVFTVALVAAVWSGSRGVDALVRAVVLVADSEERRSWSRRRLLSLGLLTGTVVSGAVVLSMFVVGPLLGGGRAIADSLGLGSAFVTVWAWLRLPLAGAALTCWSLVVLHQARPGVHPWRVDVPGALLATALWIAASIGLRAYIAVAGSANAVLGALGGALIALVWLYLLAAALLLGAELNQQLRERKATQPVGTVA